ncbi:MAG: thymidine kinase [Reichenbachiella sp.]
MFIEPKIAGNDQKSTYRTGWIEVICGSMFSGKTEELIRRLNRALLAGMKVEIFKPKMDTRYSENQVVSHNRSSIRSTPVDFANDILLNSSECDVVGIDESQFFDDELVNVVRILANDGKRVIVAGLDMDFEGVPFEPIPSLMAIAEYVTKVRAICMKCGDVASFSFRVSDVKKRVLIGEQESYESRCRKCFYDDQNRNNK